MWVVLALVGILTFLIYYLTRPPKDFWGKYGVRQVNDSPINKIKLLLGRKTIMDLDDIIYERLESSQEKFCGVVELQGNMVMIKDLDLLKKVFIKDFEYFVDRRLVVSSDSQPIFHKFLLNLRGDEWKSVRSSVSPTFTTGKIRRMMESFNKVSKEWIHHLKTKIENSSDDSSTVIKAGEEARHFTVDVISSTVFGMEAKAISNPDSLFALMTDRLSSVSPLQIAKFLMMMFLPRVVNFFRIKVIDDKALTFFESILMQGMKSRMNGETKKNDFLQLIAEVRKGELKSQDDELSAIEKDAKLAEVDAADGKLQKKNILKDDMTAIAQLLQFFFAGFSTTSNFITFALYALALNQDVQEKLREELDSKLFKDGKDGEMDYDELNGLVYLDMVVCEVFRVIPPNGRLERLCVKEYHDPETGLRVPKGAFVYTPLQAIHNDPKYYEHPDKFYPEHFTPEKKAERNPYTFLPFGMGPRNCIGMRFALVKSKAAIAQLVHNFVIEPTAKTPKSIQIKTIGIAIQPPDNLELRLRLRS